MGWGSGENYRGETVGYNHAAICTESGCDSEIDRGLAYTCGGLEGVEGQRGCGRHFCETHLSYVILDTGDDYPEEDDDENAAVCGHCMKRIEAGLPTGMADASWLGDSEEVESR